MALYIVKYQFRTTWFTASKIYFIKNEKKKKKRKKCHFHKAQNRHNKKHSSKILFLP